MIFSCSDTKVGVNTEIRFETITKKINVLKSIDDAIAEDISKCIHSLNHTILSIADSKDLSTEVRVYDKDEFGTIRTALREFVALLHETISNAKGVQAIIKVLLMS